MFEIRTEDTGRVELVGRLDASEIEKAQARFDELNTGTVVDLARLEYISSVGIGLLLATRQRLARSGQSLKLVGAQGPVREVFRFSGLESDLAIE